MNSSLTTLFIFSLALIPAIGWVLVYRYLDNIEPEPLKPTVFALFAGILSTLPVFGLQYLFIQYPQYDLLSLLQRSISTPLLFSAVFLLFVALIEEFLKGIAFLTIVRKYEYGFNQVVDGIVYGALIGIGFAMTENFYYFSKAINTYQLSTNFMAIFSIRSFGTMLAHTLFTGTFGFFFAKAYFSPFIDESSKKEKIWQNVGGNLKNAVRLHTTFFHLLPGREKGNKTFRRNAIIFEGFIVALLLHFMYNALIKLELFGRNWTFLIIPLIFILAWYIWSRFFIRIYTRVLQFVRVRKGVYKVKIH